MKEFKFEELPVDMKSLLLELVDLSDVTNLCTKECIPNTASDYNLLFKVQTAPDPELGNIHVPLAVYLVKHGANKGETVKIIGI